MLTINNLKIALQMLDFKATTRRHQAFTHPNILFSVYFLSDKTCYENIRLKLTEDLTPILKQITNLLKLQVLNCEK